MDIIFMGLLFGCLPYISPHIIKMVSYFFISSKSAEELEIEEDIIENSRQLQSMSSVDQFAACARLQRKINGLKEKFRQKESQRLLSNDFVKYGLSMVLKIIIGLCYVVFLWNNYGEPVIRFSSSMVWPVSHILSFPSCNAGEVSIVAWLAIIQATTPHIIKIYNRVLH